MHLIVGTAGHIDHGKTALVRALTGVETDRFPEEKERGITIDIGFAELNVGDHQIGFVDVPGHERFVKNMLAGASGIDAVMLIVAADEGVMPQTREHFQICRLLDIKSGLVVLTKADLVDDDELLDFVRLDVAELVADSFLENQPVVVVSSRSGAGINELKSELARLSANVQPRDNRSFFRLPIDRSFAMKGFGAVVTGTLVAGVINEGDEAELLPGGRKVRVRGLQSHGRTVSSINAGRRTAINLGGIDHQEIERGMVLAPSDSLRPTQMIDAHVEVLKSAPRALRTRQRIRLHLGTVETLARVVCLTESGSIEPGEQGFVQFRLESPTTCLPQDRFIVRQYSPQTTIAGGAVIKNAPTKHRRRDAVEASARLSRLQTAEPLAKIRLLLESAGADGLSRRDLRAKTGWTDEYLNPLIVDGLARRAIVDAGSFLLARTVCDQLVSAFLEFLREFHAREPLVAGVGRELLREKLLPRRSPDVFRAVIETLETTNQIVVSRDLIRLSDHSPDMSDAEKSVFERLQQIFRDGGLEIPKLDEALELARAGTKCDRDRARKIFQLLIGRRDVVKVTDEFYFSATAIDELVAKLRKFADSSSDRLIDVPQFKEIGGISRKYAIPLLEYFDREKITRRAGDKRLIL